jgi:gluconolactonase
MSTVVATSRAAFRTESKEFPMFTSRVRRVPALFTLKQDARSCVTPRVMCARSRLSSFTSPCLAVALAIGAGATVSAAELSDLVGGEMKKVVPGCTFTEGPAWHPDGYLLFSDVPNNRIVRVTPDGAYNDWMTDSNGTNGIMCDQQGNVYACQGDARRMARLRATGDGEHGELVAVLASEYDGRPFNKPNDVALDSHGGLYFTDPNYRREQPPQPVEGVYYLSTDGKTTRVVDDLPRPNGVLVSEDGRHLYVANINLRQVVRYRIEGPGQISAGEPIFTAKESDGGGPDGMSLDEHGNIYATYKSVIVLTPEGELIGRIEVPEKPANCAFGGADNKTLYITAQKSLYALPMQVSGIPLRAAGPKATSPVLFQDEGAAKSEETQELKVGPLTLKLPAAWKGERPSNRLRLAQYIIPAAEGDDENAELVISGPFGGSAGENVKRWLDQFDAADREVKMSQGETEQGKYIFVDLTGTYNKSIGPPALRKSQPMPGYRVLNVMFTVSDGANYFLKLSGPEKTVTKVVDGFRAAFGADKARESEYTLE